MTTPFDRIGDYCLVQLIGRGGMGEVWAAVKEQTTSPCAIKILLPEMATSDKSIEMFKREAEIGGQLGRHGTIVAIRDYGEHTIPASPRPKRLLYLVMDLVDGVNLRQLSRRMQKVTGELLPIPIVVHIIRAVLRALDAAHGHTVGAERVSVVHGDINPGNVLVSSRGEVQVTDFGIARFAPEAGWISRPVGTLLYMAPEQYLGRVCAQMDLYGAGVLLHELLTGKVPIEPCDSGTEFERKLLGGPVAPLNRSDVPEGLDRLRRGLLEKDIALRIKTAKEALAMLGEVLQTDCQDDLRSLYLRIFGPPKSRLTQYLQADEGGGGKGSFVLKLLESRRTAVPSEEPKSELSGEDPISDDDEEEGPPLWLRRDEESDAESEELIRTTIFRGREREDLPKTAPLGPKVSEPEATEELLRTEPLGPPSAPTRRKPSGYYPPRSAGWADGVPTMRHRPRGPSPERTKAEAPKPRAATLRNPSTRSGRTERGPAPANVTRHPYQFSKGVRTTLLIMTTVLSALLLAGVIELVFHPFANPPAAKGD